MSILALYKVKYKKYQAFEDGVYMGQNDRDGWVKSLSQQVAISEKHNSAYMWHILDVFQNIVDSIDVMMVNGDTVYQQQITRYHNVRPEPVVRPDAVCPAPDAGKTIRPMVPEGTAVVASDGAVYIVGTFYPVNGADTAYYDLEDKYDGWETSIKAQTLEGHLAAGNWKKETH